MIETRYKLGLRAQFDEARHVKRSSGVVQGGAHSTPMVDNPGGMTCSKVGLAVLPGFIPAAMPSTTTRFLLIPMPSCERARRTSQILLLPGRRLNTQVLVVDLPLAFTPLPPMSVMPRTLPYEGAPEVLDRRTTTMSGNH